MQILLWDWLLRSQHKAQIVSELTNKSYILDTGMQQMVQGKVRGEMPSRKPVPLTMLHRSTFPCFSAGCQTSLFSTLISQLSSKALGQRSLFFFSFFKFFLNGRDIVSLSWCLSLCYDFCLRYVGRCETDPSCHALWCCTSRQFCAPAVSSSHDRYWWIFSLFCIDQRAGPCSSTETLVLQIYSISCGSDNKDVKKCFIAVGLWNKP